MICRDSLLLALVTAYRDQVAELEADIAEREAAYYGGDRRAWPDGRDRWPLKEAREYGITLDLERLIGHALTSTERIRAQEVIRSFESQGLVWRCNKKLIMPTAAGIEAAAKILEARAALPATEAADG
jgi:hypothetical protein